MGAKNPGMLGLLLQESEIKPPITLPRISSSELMTVLPCTLEDTDDIIERRQVLAGRWSGGNRGAGETDTFVCHLLYHQQQRAPYHLPAVPMSSAHLMLLL